MNGRSVWAELKRRHVYKVGAAYAVGGWLIVQVATQVFPIFEIPTAWVRLIVVLVALGFPIALAFSWAFDLTPEGLVRTDALDAAQATGPQVAAPRIERRLNYVLAALLLLALAYLLVEHFVLQRHAASVENAESAAGAPSIAVLAFTDMSETRDQDYFADGISEELLNLLAQVPGLHVVGRTSSFSFKGKAMNIKDVGQALGVASVLEGGVRKAGDRLRVTARLVNVADGYELWSQRYDRKLTDIFAVQDDIAGAVVDALKFKLMPIERPASSKQHVPEFETYDHFLRGRQFLERNNSKFYPDAVAAFRQAIALDADYADAYAGLAMAVSFTSESMTDANARAASQRDAMGAAMKAVELGPELGDAYAARGYLRAADEWDWKGALADLQKAVILQPKDARNQLRYGYVLAILGRLPDAEKALLSGTLSDPQFAPAWYWLGRIRTARGNYDGAMLAFERTLAINADYESVPRSRAVVELLRGNAAKARDIFANADYAIGVAMAEHDLGHADVAEKMIATFVAQRTDADPYLVGAAYAWCGNREQAFAWLDRALKQHNENIQYVKYDPLLRSLRDDARYARIVSAMHLED